MVRFLVREDIPFYITDVGPAMYSSPNIIIVIKLSDELGGGYSKKSKDETSMRYFNPLNTKCRLLYLKTQFVPRSKHFSSRL